MEWEYEIKLRIFNLAIVRKKDKYRKPGLRKWGVVKRVNANACWTFL